MRGPSGTRAAVLPPRRTGEAGDSVRRERLAAARALAHDTPADDVLRAAIADEIASRRHAAAVERGPAAPRTTGLRIRREGLPDWWHAGGSLMLAAPDAATPALQPAGDLPPPEAVLLVLGAGTVAPQLNLSDAGALVAIGDGAALQGGAMSAGDGSTILIGDATTAGWFTLADIRNGGLLAIGRDCALGGGVSLLGDDAQAIRAVADGRRLNRRGGRIVIGDHVWIGDQTRLMGDTAIDHGCVVRPGAFVKDAHFAQHALIAGSPARVERTNIAWIRDDLRP